MLKNATRCLLILMAVSPFFTASCSDNLGRAFDRKKGTSKSAGSNQFQVPMDGAIVLSNRPKVVKVGPTGTGWPVTTPVFVLFNEAMNFDSIKSSSTTEPSHLFMRVKGTTTLIPASYDLILGGRLLVMRSSAPLPPRASIEVVAGTGVRDLDKATLAKRGVLGEFTTDAPSNAGPKVVFRYPEDNDKGILRSSPALLGLSVPVDPTTVTENSIYLQEKGASAKLSAGISFPLRIASAPDPRLIQLAPSESLPKSKKIEFVYTKDIKAGNVELDPGKKSPPVTFTSAGVLAVKSVKVGNPTSGFDHMVNLDNLSNLKVAVETPDETEAGDQVTVRIYGVDPSGKTDKDLLFLEKTQKAGITGSGTVELSFVGELGSAGSTKFKDGTLTLCARISRGTEITGYVLAPRTLQDSVRPTLTQLGPPVSATGTNVFLTDLNAASLMGVASEELGAAELVLGSTTYQLFASNADGTFMTNPFLLNRQTSASSLTLNLRDKAGNFASSTISGSIVQRGFVTGSVSGGTLTVVVYDHATLEGLSGVSVLVEPGMPSKPGSGQIVKTTDTNGEAVFSGLTGSRYSITLVKSGYHLFSLLNTAAGSVSLPLKPISTGTSSLSGTLGFTALPGLRARVGLNIPTDTDDDFVLETTSSSPKTFGPVPVQARRPLLVSAFAGTLPPTLKPTYALYSASLAATSGGGGKNLAPPSPLAAGEDYAISLSLSSAINTFSNLSGAYSLDFSGATGLDTSKLVEDPSVQILASLNGLPGMILAGLGFAKGSGSSWSIDGSYSLSMLVDFASLGPIAWVSTQARDTDGNLSRHRALISDPFSGAVSSLVSPAGVPTVSTPASNFTGSPSVSFQDRLSTSVLSGTLAFHTIEAVGPSSRRWELLVEDEDAASGVDTVQFPDLGASSLTGLAKGSWSIRVRDRLLLAPGLSGTEFNLVDLPRFELTFSRSKAVTHTVQ
ncbi:MAG TPA: hypothetical protein ENK02_12695 [Planctomycetes bacterium]|nr:hypothetical protein [Planctomycetota bacterium]